MTSAVTYEMGTRPKCVLLRLRGASLSSRAGRDAGVPTPPLYSPPSANTNRNVHGRVPPLDSADESTATVSLRPNAVCR